MCLYGECSRRVNGRVRSPGARWSHRAALHTLILTPESVALKSSASAPLLAPLPAGLASRGRRRTPIRACAPTDGEHRTSDSPFPAPPGQHRPFPQEADPYVQGGTPGVWSGRFCGNDLERGIQREWAGGLEHCGGVGSRSRDVRRFWKCLIASAFFFL